MDSFENLKNPDLFNPSMWSPFSSREETLNKYYAKTVEGSRKAHFFVENESISYGPTERQKFDIFGASLLPTDAPFFVYIHGGFWTEGCREDSSFMVEPLFKAGFICCIVGYDLIPKASLPEIVEEVQKAVKSIVGIAVSRGSRGVYICGHSVGSHLAAMLLPSDFLQENNKEFIKGLILICGLFDLEPLLKVPLGTELKITEEIATKYSPVKLDIPAKEIEVLVVAAKFDSPEFIRQSQSYYQVLQASGIKSRYILVEEDHFTAILKLADKDYEIVQEIIQMAHRK